jgi:hypothetical protein
MRDTGRLSGLFSSDFPISNNSSDCKTKILKLKLKSKAIWGTKRKKEYVCN